MVICMYVYTVKGSPLHLVENPIIGFLESVS